MSKEAILQRILLDADESAAEIISEAEKQAEEIISQANLRAERNKLGTQAEINEKTKSILDGKAATARLDSAKILLAEKRRVIDAVYERALEKLLSLEKSEALKLAENLLQNFAEDGDEIVFAVDYKYAKEVSHLEAVSEKKLKVSPKTSDKVCGGFILRGKNCDKDVSYGALLALDREEHQVEIAAAIF